MPEARQLRIIFWAGAIFLLALLLRYFHLGAIEQHSPFFDVFPGDLASYDSWATRISDQGWLGKDVFYQDPLYPYFLAFIYKVVGRDFFAVYAIQSVLGAATAVVVFLLGSRVFSKPAGIIGGLLYSCYAPAIFFDGLLLKVSLATFLFSLAVYWLLDGTIKQTGSRILLSGLFLGLAALTRANFLLLIPVIAFLLLLNRQLNMNRRLVMTVLFILGVMLVLVPIAARNYIISGDLVVTTSQAGQNFYIGNNPSANGTYVKLSFVRPDPLFEQDDFHTEAEKRLGRPLVPSEVSRYWLGQGLDFVKKEPLAYLQLTGRKILLFFYSYEIPDNHNFYFHKRYSGVLEKLLVTFGLISPLAVLGLLGMFFERRKEPLYLAIIQIVYIGSVILFYVFSRYRMPVMPLMALSAGYGLTLLYKQFARQNWGQVMFSLVIVATVYATSQYQAIQPFDFSHSYVDEAIAHEMRGKDLQALESYRQALALRPGYLRALQQSGKLQLRLKRYDEARQTYQEMLRVDPKSVEAKYQVMWLEKKGY